MVRVGCELRAFDGMLHLEGLLGVVRSTARTETLTSTLIYSIAMNF